MSFIPLHRPGDFQPYDEKPWFEDSPTLHNPIPGGSIVSGQPVGFYMLDAHQPVVVNGSGPVVRRRVCTMGDFDCNFWDGDAILVASDPSPLLDPIGAPIRLTFPAGGVRALGAWIGVSPSDPTDAAFMDRPLIGGLWVQLDSAPGQWEFHAATGLTGGSIPQGQDLTAPFVGLRAANGARITAACFDAALTGGRRYAELAISELSFEA